MKRHHGTRRFGVLSTVLAALSVVTAACGSSSPSGSGPHVLVPPTHNLPVLTKIGKGEGQLNLIAWLGYAQPQWVKPFEKATGCQVNAEVRRHVERHGLAHGQRRGRTVRPRFGVGDADLRLIYGGDVRPVNIKLIPSW